MQFVLSAGLIICTLVVLSQLKYMRSQNPGFNKENIVVIDGEGTDPKEPYPILKRELAQYPEILGTASAELSMGEGMGWSRSGFKYKGKDKDVYEYFIDTNYLELMGIKLLAGRNFDSHFADDTVKSVIINEAMMKDFGWTLDNAVGQQLTGYMESLSPVVIGVVKDINFRSFAEKIEPQMFHQFKSYKPWKYFVRMSAGDPSKSLATIEKVWRKIMPEYPLKYSFLDEDLRRFYEGEERWGKIVGWAGGISIFLACLGLLGLAALAAVNRTKEVGIRKVLGASVTGIVGLLSKDFLKLVVIALLIASPLAWYFMHRWLEGFAYRINIGWSVFLITAIGAMLVALVTVGVQAVKAAVANPVTSLRTE
jgi:putative ABC transport system permease protein